jgi:hypothetical protein
MLVAVDEVGRTADGVLEGVKLGAPGVLQRAGGQTPGVGRRQHLAQAVRRVGAAMALGQVEVQAQLDAPAQGQ